MSDFAAAAAAIGVPEGLVKRSAEARAKATGTSVDEVLAAWAGGVAAPAAAAPTSSTAPPEAVDQEDARRQTPDANQEGVGQLQPAGAGAQSAVTGVSRLASGISLPPPAEVSPKEALRFPVVVTVPTSGLTERIVPTLPKWLASMLVLIPLFGLLQLAGATSNDCGQGGELLTDRVSGVLVNCDGTPFEGRGEPGGGTDFIALGEQIFTGQVARANCQACHGAQGQGVTAPALTTVSSTFGSCVDHIEWVTKGTAGFQGEGRSTYGDLAKPVGGGGTMPGFGATLTPEQIGSAVAFERVRFGGVPAEEALADCGLVLPPPEGELAPGTEEPAAGTEEPAAGTEEPAAGTEEPGVEAPPAP